jgi:pyruvate/2-oxoglutarate dehydrogenase complex dihydrolipoamide dehydrogenase (E3) component
MLANSARVARYAHERKHMSDELRGRGIDLFEYVGPVRFTDPRTLQASDGRIWRGERIILATGGHAGRLDIPGSELAFTYDNIRSLQVLPDAVAVVGGADTGCQIASILADLGVRVSLFEAGPVLLPHADPAVSAEVGGAFRLRGIDVHADTSVSSLRRSGDLTTVVYLAEGALRETNVDVVFFAVGWPGNVKDLALETAGINTTRSYIPVDAYLRSEVEHIFAAGDINGRAMLVQVARLEGRVAAHNAVLGPTRQVSYYGIPSASFTDPEYGSVGLTEPDAAGRYDIVVGVARYDELLRPVADGHTEGFCKLIADRDSKEILGGHVVGEYAAEITQVIAAFMAAGMQIQQVAEVPFAFPTFTEGVTQAAQQICRKLGLGQFPALWSYLAPDD